jgi:hypothetical protein
VIPSPVRERGWGEGPAWENVADKARIAARPLIRRFAPPSPEREKGPYIAFSMPWPLGVIMASHEPLATYFQWPGS